MGAVDQAVSTMLTNYLEENPKDARTIVQKVILAATARHAARKARELVQRKVFFQVPDFPVSLQIVLTAILKNVNYFLLKVILQAERQNRAATDNFRLSCHSRKNTEC